MTPDTATEALSRRDYRQLEDWVFRDRESVEQRFGMKLEKVLELFNTDKGKLQLLEQMQRDPSLNGNINKAERLVRGNIEQLQKKESFLAKMLDLPVRAVKATLRTIAEHPILSTLSAAAIIAILIYLFGPQAAGTGALGESAATALKEEVLEKLQVATPKVSMEVAKEVPVTGGLAGAESVQEAAEALESAGSMMVENKELIQAANIPGATAQTIEEIAREIANDPNVQNYNPVERMIEMLEQKK